MNPRQVQINRRTPEARKHRPDTMLVLFASILLLIGLIILYAISPALIARGGGGLDQTQFMIRQVVYLAAGIAAFVLTASVPVTFWQRYKGWLLLGTMIVGLLPFVLQATPIGLCTNGACRWLAIGGVSFQPAEAIKFALVIFLAGFLSARIQQGRLNDRQQTLVPVGLILLALAVIVIGVQRDLGTGITIFAIVMTILFVAGLQARYFFIAMAASAALGVVFTFAAPHRIERVLTFFNHSDSHQQTTDTTGYHINQSLIAVGSGGLTGKGIGQSIQAFGYLPEAANDSIFAILAEKFGFIGTVAILGIFAGLFMRFLFIMDRTANLFYKLVVAGVFGWVCAHAVVNICAMLGLLPLTGITLPFVSFGGTSLLFMLAALGLVFQISRYSSHQIDRAERGITDENSSRRRWVGRSRDANRRRFART